MIRKNSILIVLLLSVSSTAAMGENNYSVIRFSYSEKDFLKERKFARGYLGSEIKEREKKVRDQNPQKYHVSLGLDILDLNEDKYKEIFLFVNHHDFCSRHGCDLYIFDGYQALVKNNAKIILKVTSQPNSLRVLPSKTAEYRDIEFISLNSDRVVWKFNGASYQLNQ